MLSCGNIFYSLNLKQEQSKEWKEGNILFNDTLNTFFISYMGLKM